MRIAFSGHRDHIAPVADLDTIRDSYPNAVWVHGGAYGFDEQVELYAKRNKINTVVIKPDYSRFGKVAPLKRNHLILAEADLLVACYDGRLSGGTYYTINLAKKINLPIRFTSIKK